MIGLVKCQFVSTQHNLTIMQTILKLHFNSYLMNILF